MTASKIGRITFEHRDKIALALVLAALMSLVLKGQTLGLREPGEDWFDALGYLVVGLGHGLRLLALGHIGPWSRTHLLGSKRLVTSGPYAIVRNPLYLGNWLIALGLCLIAQLRWLLIVGPFAAFALYYICALVEEGPLEQGHGQRYRLYRGTTPRFLPRSLLSKHGWRSLFDFGPRQPILRSKEYQAFLGTAVCILLMELVEQMHATGCRVA